MFGYLDAFVPKVLQHPIVAEDALQAELKYEARCLLSCITVEFKLLASLSVVLDLVVKYRGAVSLKHGAVWSLPCHGACINALCASFGAFPREERGDFYI